jgi:hypothetical protein
MKKILLGLLALIVILAIAAMFFFKKDGANPYQDVSWGKFSGSCKSGVVPDKDHGKDFKGCDYSVPKNEIPTFKSVDLPYTNQFHSGKSLPLMGSALIDLNNDGVDEVFVGGGLDQIDAIYAYKDGSFTSSPFSLPAKPANSSTYGAASFDLDSDGKTDLLLSTDAGLLFYKNTGSGFEKICQCFYYYRRCKQRWSCRHFCK